MLKNDISVLSCLPQDLNELAAIVRGELPKLSRAILCALITVDVHARDMITGMVESKVFNICLFICWNQCIICRLTKLTCRF